MQQVFIKERDEPIRLGKGNDIVRKGVTHLKSELEKIAQDKENLKVILSKELKQLEQLDELVAEKREDRFATIEQTKSKWKFFNYADHKNKLKEIRDLDISSSEEAQRIAYLKNEGRHLTEENAELSHEIEVQTQRRRQR